MSENRLGFNLIGRDGENITDITSDMRRYADKCEYRIGNTLYAFANRIDAATLEQPAKVAATDGFVRVPLEPTYDMLRAAESECSYECKFDGDKHRPPCTHESKLEHHEAREIYKTMIAAAIKGAAL